MVRDVVLGHRGGRDLDAAGDLVVAAYFEGQSKRGMAAAFVGLTAVDGSTALALRRAGS